MILVVILVVGTSLIPPLDSNTVYAKTTPPSRPDIEINVLSSQQEFEDEEGGLERKWDYVTDMTYDEFRSDLRNLPMVFDMVAIPAVQDFLEQHRTELAGRYVDTLFVRYRPYNNEIFVSIWYGLGLYQNMTASKLPDQYALKIVDEVQFKISILKQFPGEDENYQEWIDFNILKYNLLPLASIRVTYLSDKLHDLFLQNKETLVKEDATLSLPEKEPIIIEAISAAMFEEMSRLGIHYMDRPIGLYDGRITEYDTAYFEWRDYGQQDPEKEPTPEQLGECQKLGINEDNCSDAAILQKIPRRAAFDAEETAKKDAAVSSTFTMVGIGASGAGAIAIITLRKLRK
ncbi:MAG: hypothetical protein ACRD99_00625 [Nitrososphaera sp.]